MATSTKSPKLALERKMGTWRGTIWQMDRQTWLVKWSYKEPGRKYLKREQKIIVGKKILAEQFLEERFKDFQNPQRSRPPSPTVQDLLEQFWTEKSQGLGGRSVKPKTLVSYKQMIQHIVAHPIAQQPVANITAQDVQAFVTDWMATSYSKRTKFYVLRLLKMAFARAVERDIIPKNPAGYLKISQNTSAKRPTLSTEQVQQLRQALEREPQGLIIEFIVTTGVRLGEALGLTWGQIHWDTHQVTIAQQIVEVGNRAVLDTTLKTSSSHRTIPVPDDIIEKLARHREHQDLWSRHSRQHPLQESDFVFVTRHFTPILPSNVRRTFRRITQKLGWPRIHIHDLRHTYATHLYNHTKNINVVSETLGHASPAVTLSIYTHVMRETQNTLHHVVNQLFNE